jgi:hypothetical protein
MRMSCAAVAAVLVMLIGSSPGAQAQSAPPEDGNPSEVTVAAPTPAPSGEPIAAATHAAIRSESESLDMMLSDYFIWRLRHLAEALAQPTSGEGVMRGMSAGSAPQNFSAWGDTTATFYLKNDTAAFANQGYTVTGLTGLDYAYGERWLFGFNAGYERTQLEVQAFGGTKIEDGPVVGPYLSYIFGPHVAADSSFTYARLGNSFTGASSFDADRFTGAGNIDLFADSGGFKLSGVIGYLYAAENPATAAVPAVINGFPTSQDYGAVKVSTEIAYPLGDAEPYLPLAYTYETTRPVDDVGRNTLTLGIGLRYHFSDALNGSLQATDDELRTHSRDDSVSANLRLSF